MTWGNQHRRNEKAQQAILNAALELCRDVGYDALRIEAIARRAGVSKQTIYRWWPSKGVLLLEAVGDAADDSAVFPDTGDLTADLQSSLGAVAEKMVSTELGPIMVGLIDGAHHDPHLAERLMSDFIGPRHDNCLARLQTAVDRGELPPGTDTRLLLDQIYGPLYYRALVTREVSDADYVRRHLAVLLPAPNRMNPSDDDAISTPGGDAI